MTPPTMTRDRLAAFADGELTPEEAAEVVMYLADHPQDQAYVDEVMAANAALSRVFAAPMAQPVPAPILAAILGPAAQTEPARILLFRRPVAALAGLALAATIAGAALFLPQSMGGPVLAPGPLAKGTALHQAIAEQASGQTVALGRTELTVLASLPITDGHCREAEVIDRAAGLVTVALICDRGTGWAVEVALSEPLPTGTTGFVPAGGAETAALDLWLDKLGAGLTLSPAEEAEAIARNWHR